MKKKGKNGKHGKIVVAVGKAKYKVKWNGVDAASDTEHTNTSLLIVLPPAAPNKAMAAAGSDDDGDQFDVEREEDDHAVKRTGGG